MQNENNKMIVGDYAHHEIQEYQNTRVPTFLKWVYLFLPLWGLWSMYYYWEGSRGWMDRGYWHELEIAANTTTVSGSIPAHRQVTEAPLQRLKEPAKN